MPSPTGPSPANMTGKIIRPAPAEIEFKNMRFLITEQPQDATLQNYIKILQEHHVTHLVCATDPTYKTDDIGLVGVRFTEMPFPDGSPPTTEIIDQWLTLVNKEFASNPEMCVGVHCVTGLGRAPVLVAVALIELGMKYEDAVELIRKKRRGAINSRQLEFLAKYKRRKTFLKGKSKCQIQ
jgi:protein tyrosine phosphatase type 4A